MPPRSQHESALTSSRETGSTLSLDPHTELTGGSPEPQVASGGARGPARSQPLCWYTRKAAVKPDIAPRRGPAPPLLYRGSRRVATRHRPRAGGAGAAAGVDGGGDDGGGGAVDTRTGAQEGAPEGRGRSRGQASAPFVYLYFSASQTRALAPSRSVRSSHLPDKIVKSSPFGSNWTSPLSRIRTSWGG
jgi:hypothetical protein